MVDSIERAVKLVRSTGRRLRLAGQDLFRRNTLHPVETFVLGIGFADGH